MARPTKQGIDYFPLDCSFDDKTEMYLIEKGATGLAVLISIWQMIYSNEGYYIVDNDDLHLLIKRKIDSGINEVSDCINTCLRRNLFDNDLYQKHGILTSKAIQKRFFEAARKKKSVKANKQFLLIQVDSYKNLVYSDINRVNVDGNDTKEKEEVKEEVKVKEKEEVNQIFAHWKEMLNHPQAKFDSKRKGWIVNALKNYSAEELKKAITGCSKTAHNIGQNDRNQIYDGLHIIFKDSENIERFIRNADNKPIDTTRGKHDGFEQRNYKTGTITPEWANESTGGRSRRS